MTTDWSASELDRVGRTEELQIATPRADGTWRTWVPIWVVCVGQQVYVRTWYRRDNGWFGQVLRSRRAKVRAPGVDVKVGVADVSDNAEVRTGVDAAYRAKYGHYGRETVDRMTTDSAAATTLRLTPERGSPDSEGN